MSPIGATTFGSEGGIVSIAMSGSAQSSDSFAWETSEIIGVTFSVVKPSDSDVVMVSLEGDNDQGQGVSFSFRFSASEVSLLQPGSVQLSLGSYTASDVFEIRVSVDGEVEYVLNSITRFTSSTAPPDTLTVFTTLTGVGSSVRRAFLRDKTQWCENVACEPLSQCHQVGTCFEGVCSNPLRPVGTSCNDGSAGTIGDVCQEDGTCQGVDPCEDSMCEPFDDCHPTPVCSPSSGGNGGECFAGPAAPDGTPCDDNDPDSNNDMCVSGVCEGTPPTTTTTTSTTTSATTTSTATMTTTSSSPTTTSTTTTTPGCGGRCEPSDSCHADGICRNNLCFTGPALDDGTPCSDSMDL